MQSYDFQASLEIEFHCILVALVSSITCFFFGGGEGVVESVKKSNDVTSQSKGDKFFMIGYSDYCLLFTDYY